jgi:hypothetical protein
MTGIIRDNEKNNKIIRAIFHMTKYSLTITNIQQFNDKVKNLKKVNRLNLSWMMNYEDIEKCGRKYEMQKEQLLGL